MNKSPFDDFLQELEAKGKLGPTKKRRKTRLAKEFVRAIEEFDELGRRQFRPLTLEEKTKLEELINEVQRCGPKPEDFYIITKLFAVLLAATEEEMDTMLAIIFSLGMAYEKLTGRGQI